MTKLALLLPRASSSLSLPAIAMSQNSCRYFPQLGNICARNRVKATRDYGVPSIFFNKLRYRKNTQGTVTSVKGSKVYIKWDNCRNCLNDGAAYWTEPKNGNIKRVGHISPVPGPSPTSCRRGARAKVTNTLAWANRHQIHDHVELLKLVTTARCRTRKAWEVMNLDQSQQPSTARRTCPAAAEVPGFKARQTNVSSASSAARAVWCRLTTTMQTSAS